MAFFSMMKIFLLCTASLSLLLATPASGQNHLLPGERLNSGQSLIEGSYTLTIQRDCNFVLYKDGEPKWASQTGHRQGSICYVTMQTDGNLVIYGYENRAIWASNTAGEKGNFVFLLQKDGNAVIYSKPTWSTGTSSYGSASVVIKPGLNGTVGAYGAEKNKVRKMGKIMEVMRDE
ncbi:hypothetical protein KFK09_006562 [Dendrobium nobile]|uniref:Bulb-type lectin domain-containing protein n=1 Tax=Dendrobium nobile TaxID=94219 RepID=A0A8T3BPL2_DENNO|nr:hypothetical protein KFK09_006562 [Dendrobium nobile]